MINLKDFVQQIEEECQTEDNTLSFTPKTAYKDIENWSSLLALIVIVKITDCYNVILDEDDLRQCDTLKDLHALVVERSEE